MKFVVVLVKFKCCSEHIAYYRVKINIFTSGDFDIFFAAFKNMKFELTSFYEFD